MKRNLYILALVLVLVLSLALTGCSKPCEHEWKDANCSAPKTCKLCDATEGAPLGHTWKAATCNAAKTCEVCGKVDGEPLGHTWVDATCEAPKTCSTCKTEEGEALGHTWVDATTEAPKTCSTCQATEGDPIDVDDRFVTANCEALFGSWSGGYSLTDEDAEMSDYADFELVYNVSIVFRNDGTVVMTEALDLDACKEDYIAYTIAGTYMVYESVYGMDKAATDAAMVAESGMTVPEFTRSYIDSLTQEDLAVESENVYYVDGDVFYMDLEWLDEMEEYEYTLESDTLTINYYGIDMTLTKDVE